MLYSTSDLINRAKDLADCGNTDFLSHEEAERYLNEAYNEVYQLAINRGDDAFVRKMTTNGGDVPLPKDFYALRSVKSSNGYMFKRKPLDAIHSEPGYNIINGRLIISGNISSAEVTYYPLPKHLTIQIAEKQPCDNLEDKGYTVSDVNNQYFVYYEDRVVNDETVHYLVVFDLLNDTSIEETIDYVPELIVCSKSSFFVKDEDGAYREYSYASIAVIDAYIPTSSTRPIPVKVRNGLTKIAYYDDVNKFLNFEGHLLQLDFEDSDKNLDSIIVASPAHLYYIDDNGSLYEYERHLQEATLIDTDCDNNFLKYKQVDKEDGVLYYKDSPMVFSRGFNRNNVVDEIRQPLDVDYIHFYGFNDNYVLYGDGVNMYVMGNLPDVVMNYPNSAFYALIAYKIALYLQAKQQADVSILQAQYEKALQDYYDNSTDDYNVVRITNIYA